MDTPDDLAVPGFLDRKKNPQRPATIEERRVYAAMSGAKLQHQPRPRRNGDAPPTDGCVTLYLIGKRGLADGYHSARVIERGRLWAKLEAGGKRLRVSRTWLDEQLGGAEGPAATKEETAMTTDTTKADETKKVTTRLKQPKADKTKAKVAPARKTKPAEREPRGKTAKLIAAMTRKGGATRAELQKIGKPTHLGLCGTHGPVLAKKWGLKWSTKEVAGEERFFMTK